MYTDKKVLMITLCFSLVVFMTYLYAHENGVREGMRHVKNVITYPEHVNDKILIYGAEQAPDSSDLNVYRVLYTFKDSLDSCEFKGDLEDLMMHGFDLHAVVEWSNL